MKELESARPAPVRTFTSTGLSGLERWLEGFDGNFVVGTDPNGELFLSKCCWATNFRCFWTLGVFFFDKMLLGDKLSMFLDPERRFLDKLVKPNRYLLPNCPAWRFFEVFGHLRTMRSGSAVAMEGRRGEVGLVWLGARGALDPQIGKFWAKFDLGLADFASKTSWIGRPLGLEVGLASCILFLSSEQTVISFGVC